MIHKLGLAFLAVTFASQITAADSFPPAWSVGDSWQVNVKRYQETIEGRETTEREFQEYTKVYQVIDTENIGGRPTFKVRITVSGTATVVIVRIDQERRYVVNYEVVGGSGTKQIGDNRIAPQDSVVGAIPGSSNCLLDFVVFPILNVNEERVVVAPGVNAIAGYQQKIVFSPTTAEVTWAKSDGEETTAVHTQLWKIGDKWPETASKQEPSESGALVDQIVETLVR